MSVTDASEAQDVLGDAVHVLAHIGGKLRGNGSLYASVFDVLVNLSPVAPEPLTVPPIRDMDEALDVFGVSDDGAEPLLKPDMSLMKAQLPKVAPINLRTASAVTVWCHAVLSGFSVRHLPKEVSGQARNDRIV